MRLRDKCERWVALHGCPDCGFAVVLWRLDQTRAWCREAARAVRNYRRRCARRLKRKGA